MRRTGNPSTATGGNAAAITATVSHQTITTATLVRLHHTFRMSHYPVMEVGGYPRFQYGDFSFSVVDPVPEYWSDDWYDNNDVYIDYSGDGYYLFNRRYPDDRVALSVSLN